MKNTYFIFIAIFLGIIIAVLDHKMTNIDESFVDKYEIENEYID